MSPLAEKWLPWFTRPPDSLGTQSIFPGNIQPSHGIGCEKKVEKLKTSLEKDGWLGRPLLVIRTDGCLQAMTGVHRLAAATRLSLEVPALVSCVDHDTKSALIAANDFERIQVFHDLGDYEATVLMYKECVRVPVADTPAKVASWICQKWPPKLYRHGDDQTHCRIAIEFGLYWNDDRKLLAGCGTNDPKEAAQLILQRVSRIRSTEC